MPSDTHPYVFRLPGNPTGVHTRALDPARLKTFYEPKISLDEGIRMALEETNV